MVLVLSTSNLAVAGVAGCTRACSGVVTGAGGVNTELGEGATGVVASGITTGPSGATGATGGAGSTTGAISCSVVNAGSDVTGVSVAAG